MSSFNFQPKPVFPIDYSTLEEDNVRGSISNEPEKTNVSINIATWNVNGIRTMILVNKACKDLKIDKVKLTNPDYTMGLGAIIKEHDLDVACLQETRMSDAYYNNFTMEGWTIYTSESKGSQKAKRGPNNYSGTAIFVKNETMGTPIEVLTEIPGYPSELQEGRFIALQFPKEDGTTYWIVNVYTPNSGSNTFQRRELWNPLMYAFLNSLENVIYCGDLNVARTIYDTSSGNMKSLSEMTSEKKDEYLTDMDKPGFKADERLWLSSLLDSGFTDVWRHMHPDAQFEGYTHVENFDRHKLRIDYHLVKMTRPFQVTSCKVLSYDKKSSDHIPLVMSIRL